MLDATTVNLILSAGSAQIGAIAWLILSMLKLQRQVDRISVEINYLRREQTLANGWSVDDKPKWERD